MEFTATFEPMIIIFLSILLGALIGVITTFFITLKDRKETLNELDSKNKELDYWKKQFTNKYTDDDDDYSY